MNLEKQALPSVCNGGHELSIGERVEGAFAQTVAIPHAETSRVPGRVAPGVVGDPTGRPAWVSQGQHLLPGVTQGRENPPLAPGLLPLATHSDAALFPNSVVLCLCVKMVTPSGEVSGF